MYLQACILVFDVTNKLSFDSLEYWLQEFTSNGGKQAVIAVVANKVCLVQPNLQGIQIQTVKPLHSQQVPNVAWVAPLDKRQSAEQ